MIPALFTVLLCLSSGLLIEANEGCVRDGGDVCRCPSGWTQRDKQCFLYVQSQKDWSSAQQTCIEHGGNLASFHSRADYDFLRTVAFKATGTNPRTWVGASNAVKNEVWLWADGSLFNFISWGPTEPNNVAGQEHCMEINRNGGDYINDERCTTSLFFVCAKAL